MKILYLLSGLILMPLSVNAECTPTPSCEDMGYTASSCESGGLRCPFDATKWYCVPCDSSYRYTCNGANMTGGTGDACGGKYVSCVCAAGYTFSNGACVAS